MSSAGPLVTIILLTKNGSRYLDEMLTHVLAQKTEFSFAVIAIDSGSTDTTLAILARYPVQTVSIPAEQFNHGETRNLGARLARGNFVVYLTQDATPANDQWLQNLITPLAADASLVAVCSRQLPRRGCNPVIAGHLETAYPLCAAKEEIKHFPGGTHNKHITHGSITLSNVSAAYRKTTLLRYPFPRTDFAEDAAWEFCALSRGDTTMFQPQSQVLHSHAYPLAAWLRRCYLHAWAMQQIFSTTGTRRDGTPHQRTKNVRSTLHNDWVSLGKRNIRGVQRLRWLGYGIAWHGTALVGALLGARGEKNPAMLHRLLAHRQRLWRPKPGENAAQ